MRASELHVSGWVGNAAELKVSVCQQKDKDGCCQERQTQEAYFVNSFKFKAYNRCTLSTSSPCRECTAGLTVVVMCGGRSNE